MTGEKMQEVSCNFHGPVTSIAWMPLTEGNLVFVFGCVDGSLHVYRRMKGSVGVRIDRQWTDIDK
jgi:hypothetical protein